MGIYGAVPGAPRMSPGRKMRGVIKSWKDSWGFINSNKYQGDLFCHKDSLSSDIVPAGGLEVQFSIGHDKRGREMATDVTLAAIKKTNTSLQSLIGSTLEGSVRSWKEKWGFITSDQF